MRFRRVVGAVILLLMQGWSTTLAEPVVVMDDIGREVVLTAPAKRVVSLAPHLTETLFALGVGDQIVGTVRYADFPAAAQQIPRFGDAFSVNVESVIGARPDIVFAWQTGGTMRSVNRIADLGVPVYINEAPTPAAIARSIEALSVLVGVPDRGAALAAQYRDTLASLRRKSERPVPVFFQISDERLYTVNDRHLIGQSISWCGGRNVFADLAIPVPLVSEESVVAARPRLIVLTRVPGSEPSSWFRRWQDHSALSARVVGIDPNLISRPGIRMVDGIAAMCELIAAVTD